jgi:ubiquinone/menaquinone biosynthesis C-methylase UbiE
VTEPVDYEQIAKVYDLGRFVPLDRIGGWRDALAPYLHTGVVLDLGSGTGLFSEALVTWFDVSVIGVEPSDAMRAHAAAKGIDRVTYLRGSAEELPLDAHSIDAAWLSTVIHHIADLSLCAGELRRVLKPGAPVLIRNSFSGRFDGIHWLDYFPAARSLASRRWPAVDAVARALATAGFEVETLTTVPETVADDLSAYAQRIGTRANSTLRLIDDAEFERGMARLRADARNCLRQPVTDRRDLLVLRQRDE